MESTPEDGDRIVNGLPPQLKVEVKFTTSASVSIPTRERKALRPDADGAAGVIAVMCLCGDRELDGRWILVDPEKAFARRKAEALSARIGDLARISEQQRHFQPLRDAVSTRWSAFLQAYVENAVAGRAILQNEFKKRCDSGTLGEPIGVDRVLDIDHLANLRRVVSVHGEGVAGGIFQDFFAALLRLIGYANVVSNPVGVPDVTAFGLRGSEPIDLGTFSRDELDRIAELCAKAGEAALAARLRKHGTG
jgi:hypothetical protein